MEASQKIKKEDALKISRETLERLAITRPEHRQTRIKFDQTLTECLDQKNNKSMTGEDDIHESAPDAFFRNSLRPLGKSMLYHSSKKEEDGGDAKKPITGVQNPPSFYQADMDKWMNNKFASAIKDRDLEKNRIRNSGCYMPFGTANPKITTKTLKRRASRGSLPGFSNVDFNVAGNTNDIYHLLKHSRGPNNHAPSDLNFEANLRTWQSKVAIQHEKPFRHPSLPDKFDSVGVFKG